MIVKIDVSVHAADAATARREFGGLRPKMVAAVKSAAQLERATHEYQNRTGNLQRSTQGLPTAEGAEIVMTEEYASFVRRLGLSSIDEAAGNARLAIDTEIDRIGRALGVK